MARQPGNTFGVVEVNMTMKHLSMFRITIVLAASSLGSACAYSNAMPVEEQSKSKIADSRVIQSGFPMECPSQDFMEFMQSYADAEDDSVRRHYTSDPLAYDVPYHTVHEETETSPEMYVSTKIGDERIDYFRYRYFRWADTFDSPDAAEDPIAVEAMKEGTKRYPIKVSSEPNGDRKVVFGLEYELDIYEFKRSEGCWYLTRVLNPRD